MALPMEVRRLFNMLLNSGSIRGLVLPANTAYTTVTTGAADAMGAWGQVVASVGTADVLLVGVGLTTPSDPAVEYLVAVGSGAAAAEVELTRVQFMDGYIPFLVGLFVLNATRLAARATNSGAATPTIQVKVHAISGF